MWPRCCCCCCKAGMPLHRRPLTIHHSVPDSWVPPHQGPVLGATILLPCLGGAPTHPLLGSPAPPSHGRHPLSCADWCFLPFFISVFFSCSLSVSVSSFNLSACRLSFLSLSFHIPSYCILSYPEAPQLPEQRAGMQPAYPVVRWQCNG